MNKGILEVLAANQFSFNNPAELASFELGFYFFCIVLGLVFLGFAYLRASSIHWDARPKPTCHITRRIWFSIFFVVVGVLLFGYTEFYIQRSYIPSTPPMLLTIWDKIQLNGILLGIGAYLVIGLFTSFIGKGKWKTITSNTVK
jgi:hypothetical protein